MVCRLGARRKTTDRRCGHDRRKRNHGRVPRRPCDLREVVTLAALGWLAIDITVRLHWLQGNGGTIKVPMEEYVAAVLGGEAAGMKSPESMKAMAVAARTYAARFKGKHSKEGFDFCDTTHCQDFRRSAITQAGLSAVEETEGEMLWYQGAAAATYYSQNCGGLTEQSSEGPYLKRQADPYCSQPPKSWQTILTRDQIARALQSNGRQIPPGFTQIHVIQRTPSQRITQINISGTPVDGSAFQVAIGRALGWSRLPSTWFDVKSINDRFVFEGRGSGHGIGLCQDGCDRMGQDRKDYREILAFYYPGTVISGTASGISWRQGAGERVTLRAMQIDQNVVEKADQAFKEAERLSRLRFNGRPTVRIYPTVSAFRDATGQPGTVAAVTSGSTIRLQPAATLRARNVLDSTLLHEMLHVVLEANTTAKHPLWFREGMVLVLANEAPSDPQYRDAVQRVRQLIDRFGRSAVDGWWKSGLPRDAGPDSIHQSPGKSKSQHKAK